ncbi:unnamed protein product [Nippostrongylus brasiliensis]|uniref:Probable splicing factor, arginine/serine-rich 6 (inferred by orthology to a C. elegans protein) n=1 Tax=Nippostrongylus brasiliensis TaxID=27835 RepID=A0A0N4YA46_NIPBR|nr:unnamed protein product [Nippostrongylus brasiliensis]
MDCKVYVGGLPNDATSQEIEDAFYRFGRIRKVWVARRPPGFAFVEFEDSRDAEDAVKALDGSRICGVRARVELSHGRGRGAGNGGYGVIRIDRDLLVVTVGVRAAVIVAAALAQGAPITEVARRRMETVALAADLARRPRETAKLISISSVHRYLVMSYIRVLTLM